MSGIHNTAQNAISLQNFTQFMREKFTFPQNLSEYKKKRWCENISVRTIPAIGSEKA